MERPVVDMSLIQRALHGQSGATVHALGQWICLYRDGPHHFDREVRRHGEEGARDAMRQFQRYERALVAFTVHGDVKRAWADTANPPEAK